MPIAFPTTFWSSSSGGGTTAPAPTTYWEADYGVVTTTNGTTADSSPVSGNKVMSWTSKDGSAKVISQSTNSTRPTYYAPTEGKPYIRFDSTVAEQFLIGQNIGQPFDNLSGLSMGVSLRRPGIYSSYRNEPYCRFNYGWSGVNGLAQGAGAYPSALAGGEINSGGSFLSTTRVS